MIAGHNLFDSVRAEELGGAAWAWHLLHEPGLVPLGHGVNLYVLYPLIPWIGVMAAGYLLGPVMQLEERARQRLLFTLGAAVTLGFIVLRSSNLYGDPAPWIAQETLLSTILSFLNCEKYPPSSALSDDDAGARADAACFLRTGGWRLRPLACHVRTGSLLLLRRPHLSDPRARRRHGLCHDRRPYQHAYDRLRSAGYLFRLAPGARPALSNLPLVRCAEGERHGLVVELSVNRCRKPPLARANAEIC